MWYPPYSEMICIRFTDTDKEKVRKSSFLFKESLGDINKIPQRFAILGPIPSGISKIKNNYRWQIIIKCENADLLNEKISAAVKSVKTHKDFGSVAVSIDKNPSTIY